MFYEKKITYLDVYEGGERKQNAGYVKLEVRGEQVTMQVWVEKLRHTDTGVFDVILVCEDREVMIDKITLENGRGTLQIQGAGADVVQGICYEAIQRIVVKLTGERMLCCEISAAKRKMESTSGHKKEEDVQKQDALSIVPGQESGEEEEGLIPKRQSREEEEGIVPGQESGEEEEVTEPKEVLSRQDYAVSTGESKTAFKEKNTVFEENRRSLQHPQAFACRRGQSTTKWQELWKIYPHIFPFGDNREYLKIMPQDLVVLPQNYYPLVSNSFLCHGFFNYEHLILARQLRGEEEHFYIGVPGNYYKKEKQVAVLFGFESFEGEMEPAKEGAFGYYMISVEL